MNKKRVIALLLAICMLTGLPSVAEKVFATSAEDKKNQAENDLNHANSEMENIKDSQQEVENEIAKVKKQLNTLLANQNALEKEIAANQTAIEQTEIELAQAQEDEREQYEAMKLRIQYMYENSTKDSLFEAIIEAQSIADLLKRVEYVAAVHKADRQLTEKYQQVVLTIEEKQQTLLEQRSEFFAKREAYLGQQSEIESMMAMLKDEQDAYASQLAAAEKKAAEYKKIIKEQEEIIRQQQMANSKPNYGNGISTAEGRAIVEYALQYVGYPYKWGGKTSFKEGVDCSGFVYLVCKHFGYKVPSYSFDFLLIGTSYKGTVVELKDIQPGDIVIYAANGEGVGHVAIYMGDGKIVEAQSTKAGITCNRNLESRKIIGIRRVAQ